MKTQWTNPLRVLLVALALVLATGFLMEAKAGSPFDPSTGLPMDPMFCRDCPFPMKVGEGQWMMPNGYLRIDIVERKLPKSLTEVRVQLVDARNGMIVAEGFSRQRRTRTTVNIQLMDSSGKPVQGFIKYIDKDKEQIQAKFTCESCAISDMID